MTTIATNGTKSNIENSLQLCYVPNLTVSYFAYFTILLASCDVTVGTVTSWTSGGQIK